jgi:hypothetical protein
MNLTGGATTPHGIQHRRTLPIPIHIFQMDLLSFVG